MTLLDLEVAIPKLRDWAYRRPAILAMFIYGSYAKGTARPDSDLDLAVAVRPEAGDEDPATAFIFLAKRWTAELTELLKFPRVHLEWLHPENPPVLDGVRDSNMRVYVAHEEQRDTGS
jgi:predicted nucleotidyltransferase